MGCQTQRFRRPAGLLGFQPNLPFVSLYYAFHYIFMTLAAIKVITFLRQHRRIAGKCGRIARHIHNTFTIRCGKANKAYAASAPQHKHRCAADQAAFYPIAPRCNRAWVHFKQIGRLKSTHWFHSYMKQALSRVCRTNSPPLKAEHLSAFLVHQQLPQNIQRACRRPATSAATLRCTRRQQAPSPALY